MQLNDPRMIEQAKRTHMSEAEPLYWLLEDALADNNIDQAKVIYNIFLYLGQYRKDIIKHLHTAYRQRLKEIAFEIYSDGTILKHRDSISLKRAISPHSLPFNKEKELQQFLYDHPQILREALQDDISIKGLEVDTDFNYRCDIVAESKLFFYPIELKIGQANHQVVSQINKYCWFFYRKLRYNFYRQMQGVVCAAGWDAWSVNEIRREGHWCFTIIPNEGGGIKLEKV